MGTWVHEVAHQMSLLPIVAVLAAACFGRRVPAPVWLLACAFGVSWLGDSLQNYLGGAFKANYAWLPLQFCFAYAAVLHGKKERDLVLFAVLAVAALSFTASFPRPEFLLNTAGSIGLLLYTGTRSHYLTAPVWLHFGLGTCAYLMMAGRIGGLGFGEAWWAYQACRLAAIVALISITIIHSSHHRRGS